MIRGALLVLAALAAPAQAQQTESAPPTVRDVRTVPVQTPRHPQRARAERAKGLDIPQAAKDEGHNGSVTFVATVGVDGILIGLALKESSMSSAIDEAAAARARALRYWPATDNDGNKAVGEVNVRMTYARYDSDSPGGGIDTYTCGDLVREYDWFTAANIGRRKLFWPENAYTSLTSVEQLLTGEMPSREDRLAARQKREKMWANLIKRCRKTPDRLMLEEVDQPEAYARLVNSF